MNTFPLSQGYMSDISNELLGSDLNLFKTLLEDAGRDTSKHVHGAFRRYSAWVDSHGINFSATQGQGKDVSFAVMESALDSDARQETMSLIAERLMQAQDRDVISIVLVNQHLGSDTTLDYHGRDLVKAYPTHQGVSGPQTIKGELGHLLKELSSF